MAVELHSNSDSDSSYFDAQISYTTGTLLEQFVNVITAGPYINPPGSDKVILSYHTSQACPTEINYGTDDDLSLNYTDTTLTKHHEAILENLSPNTVYDYEINGVQGFLDIPGNQHFQTAPAIGNEKNTTIWVTGDFGNGLPTQHLVYADFLLKTANTNVDLWMWLGDNAYDKGTFGEYQRNVFDIYRLSLPHLPILPSLGNHDVESCVTLRDEGPYFDLFNLPTQGEFGGEPSGTEAYYSYDYGNIHFICLESTDNNRMPDGPMLDWLKRDLQQNTKKWTVAFWHHPPYSKGSHDSDTEGRLIEMRENVNPLLEKFGVDLVLTGHSHDYERSYFLNGHYGFSDSFNMDEHTTDGGKNGNIDDDEAYEKTIIKAGNQGTVYAVVGSSGSPYTEGSLDHPANIFSSMSIGSMLLNISGDTLSAEFISPTDFIQTDKFNIVKTDEKPICEQKLDLGSDTIMSCFEAIDLAASDEFWTYQWSTGENTTSISAKDSGWYFLEVKLFEDCFNQDSVYIAYPTLNINTLTPQFCNGDSVIIQVNNAENVTWNGSIFSNTFTVKSNDTILLNATVNDCEIIENIYPEVIEIANISSDLQNDSLLENPISYFLNNDNDYTYFVWYFGDGDSSLQASGQHFYQQKGEYQVELNVENEICKASAFYDVNKNTITGIDELNNVIKIYPAIVSTKLNVEAKENIESVLVRDSQGKVIYNTVIDAPKTSISTQNWAKGNYILMLTIKGQKVQKQFVVG